jgi:hypothetical protein
MGEKEGKVKQDIERRRQDRINEDKSDKADYRSDRDITKMEDPAKWPDPPPEKGDDTSDSD